MITDGLAAVHNSLRDIREGYQTTKRSMQQGVDSLKRDIDLTGNNNAKILEYSCYTLCRTGANMRAFSVTEVNVRNGQKVELVPNAFNNNKASLMYCCLMYIELGATLACLNHFAQHLNNTNLTFYTERTARMFIQDRIFPFILPLKNEEKYRLLFFYFTVQCKISI